MEDLKLPVILTPVIIKGDSPLRVPVVGNSLTIGKNKIKRVLNMNLDNTNINDERAVERALAMA